MTPSDTSIPNNTQLQRCFSEAKLNGLTLKNRLIKAGTFENMTPEGKPSATLRRFHNELADGGIGMTTIAYCAVEPDGRLKPGMMYMGEHLRKELSDMIADLHQRGTKVAGQMGHGGGFSQTKPSQRKRPLGPSFGLNALGIINGNFFCDPMSLLDIDNLVQAFHDAAVFMKSIGFDALEIHFGHGYGLCQFMSPKTNRRKDEYGGSLENRMRLPLRVLKAVREAVGPDFPILGKISMTEGVRGGLNYDDAVEISRMLDEGGIDGIITSGGTSTMNPMIMFRGGNMLPTMLRYEKKWLMRLILRLGGKALFRDYPYEELYFLEQAKRIRAVVKCNMVYIGGASCNESFARVMEAGFDFIQLGRTLLSDPDLPLQAQQDPNYKSRCTHCNECVGTIECEGGIHCPVFFPR